MSEAHSRLAREPAPIKARAAWPRSWALPLGGIIFTLAFWLFFAVMHLRSQAWARGQVLDQMPEYWNWFYSFIFSYDQVQAVRRSPEAAWHPLLMVGVLLVLSGAYLWLLTALRRGVFRLRLPGMLVLVLLASVPLLALPNLQSGDIYSYISFGRIAAIHDGNPFTQPPADFSFDRLSFIFVNWKQVPSVYGPTWIYASMLLTTVIEATRSHMVNYIVGYKLLALACHIANGVLIWLILGRMRPQQQQWGTALYLLCPLVLIESVGNGHNDVLMITCMLAALWLHLRGWWLAAIAAFTLAVLTKWIALLVLPLYGLVLLWESRTWRQRAWRTLASLSMFSGLCVALYSPYWEGSQTLRILVDAPPQRRLINSVSDVVSNEIQQIMARMGYWPEPIYSTYAETVNIASARHATLMLANNPDTQSQTSAVWQNQAEQFAQERSQFRTQQTAALANRELLNKYIRNAVLGVLLFACLLGAALTRSFERMIVVGAWLFFVYCTIGAVWFWPWYLTWFIALAALVDWRVTGRTAIMIALLSPLVYVFFPPTSNPTWWQQYRALMVFGPPMLYAGWHGYRLLRTEGRRALLSTGTRLARSAARRPASEA